MIKAWAIQAGNPGDAAKSPTFMGRQRLCGVAQ
jgi:hypothetical protein